MKILAIVPARAGSKRIPGKNIRPLAGKPLVLWTLDLAAALPQICDTLVSSDDERVVDLCRSAGAMAPWLRPRALSTDEASSVDVALHALDWYEDARGSVDGLLLLQPTSPFRRQETIARALDLFQVRDRRPVVGVSRAVEHPLWCFTVDGLCMRPFVSDEGLTRRSQDLPAAYAVNGSCYLITPSDLRRNRSFFAKEMTPLICEAPEERIDIDTEWDWTVAECAAQRLAKAGDV